MLRGTATIALKPLEISRCGSPGNYGVSCEIPIWLLGDAPKSPSAAAPISPLLPTIRCFHPGGEQHRNALARKAFACSRRFRPRFNLSARPPDEPATPASRRGFAAPRSEKPPPWGGGLRCRWMILGHRARTKDRFAAKRKPTASRFATGTMLACGANKAMGNGLHAARIRPRHRHNLGRVRRDRPRFRGRHGKSPPSRRANLPGSPRSEGRAVEPGAAAGAPSPPSTASPTRAPPLAW